MGDGTAIIGYRLFDNRGNLRILPQSPFGGLDLSGDFLYAANNSGNTISGFQVDRMTGDLLQLTGSPYLAGSNPTSVTLVNDFHSQSAGHAWPQIRECLVSTIV